MPTWRVQKLIFPKYNMFTVSRCLYMNIKELYYWSKFDFLRLRFFSNELCIYGGKPPCKVFYSVQSQQIFCKGYIKYILPNTE